MRPSKGTIAIVSLFAELILQHRINVKSSFLSHLKDFQAELPFVRNSQSWQEQLTGVLDSQPYQIKRRIITKDKSITSAVSVKIDLISTCKTTSESQRIQTWVLQAKRLHPLLELQDCVYRQECIDMLEVLLNALSTQCIFSDVITHSINKRKFIIDFQIDIQGTEHTPENLIYPGASCWMKNAVFDQSCQISLKCYHQSAKFKAGSDKFGGFQIQKMTKLASLSSQDTNPTIGSNISSPFSPKLIPFPSRPASKRHHSSDFPSPLLTSRSFEIQEDDFTMIVLSSSDQSQKRSSGWIIELDIQAQEEDEQFQLLVDINTFNFQSEWIRQNDQLFKKLEEAQETYFN